MPTLFPISTVSGAEVDKLLDAAFGADRHGRTAYLLRRGMKIIDHLSFALINGDELAGSIQCWPVTIDTTPLILVGPVAVLPERQNQGLGHRLMHAALAAVQADDPPMVMVGDPEYYQRFGFSATGTGGWTLPGPWEPRRLLLRNPAGVPLPAQGMLEPRAAFDGSL